MHFVLHMVATYVGRGREIVTKKLLRCNGISFQDRKMYKVIVVINFKLKALFNMLNARSLLQIYFIFEMMIFNVTNRL